MSRKKWQESHFFVIYPHSYMLNLTPMPPLPDGGEGDQTPVFSRIQDLFYKARSMFNLSSEALRRMDVRCFPFRRPQPVSFGLSRRGFASRICPGLAWRG
jgi:hypothetical protein